MIYKSQQINVLEMAKIVWHANCYHMTNFDKVSFLLAGYYKCSLVPEWRSLVGMCNHLKNRNKTHLLMHAPCSTPQHLESLQWKLGRHLS